MSPIAGKLTPDEIAAVADYCSRLTVHEVNAETGDAALIARGTTLATIGSLPERIQACQSCHGPNGRGEAPGIPRLAGQYSHYIVSQLEMWRRGYRKNDPGWQMKDPAHNLSPQDIEAVAAYFAQLPVPTTQVGGQRNGR